MQRKHKTRLFTIFLAIILLSGLITNLSFASSQNIITGFSQIENNQINFVGKPEKKELIAKLPKNINVYLNNNKNSTPINVHWDCVEDYDNTSFYIYSFVPSWDKTKYKLSKRLNEAWDIPWIFAYKKETINESSGISSLCSVLESESTSNEAKAYKYLTSTLKLNKAAACGVLANLNAESGIKPNNLENYWEGKLGYTDDSYTKAVDSGKYKRFTKDYAGYGICQWTSAGRKANLLAKKNKMKVSIANLNMQLAFLNEELQNYDTVIATLKNVPNTEVGAFLAATMFCYSFERPAYTDSTSLARGKIAVAGYWSKYKDNDYDLKTSYLGICGYSYPKQIKTGNGVVVDGEVISNYKLKSINAKIVDCDENKTYYSKTVFTDYFIYDLFDLDSYMKFSKLRSGYYKYIITAKDVSGKTVSAEKSFKVSSNYKETLTDFALDSNKISTLRVTNYNYPKLIKKGLDYAINGTVASNYKINLISVKILNSYNKTVFCKTVKPNATAYLLNKLNSSLNFAKLKGGKYRYLVTAKDDEKSLMLINKYFNVNSKKIINFNYPSVIKKGHAFSIKGKIASDLILEKVNVKIINSKGKTLISKTDKPNSTFYYLSRIDRKIKFGTLYRGTYIYKITATDTSSSSALLSKKFIIR